MTNRIGLFGNQLDDFFDDDQAALFVERRFEHRDVVGELDGDAVMGAPARVDRRRRPAVASLTRGVKSACRTASGTVTGSGQVVGPDVFQLSAERVMAGGRCSAI